MKNAKKSLAQFETQSIGNALEKVFGGAKGGGYTGPEATIGSNGSTSKDAESSSNDNYESAASSQKK